MIILPFSVPLSLLLCIFLDASREILGGGKFERKYEKNSIAVFRNMNHPQTNRKLEKLNDTYNKIREEH